MTQTLYAHMNKKKKNIKKKRTNLLFVLVNRQDQRNTAGTSGLPS
jgi:hypothetical protein